MKAGEAPRLPVPMEPSEELFFLEEEGPPPELVPPPFMEESFFWGRPRSILLAGIREKLGREVFCFFYGLFEAVNEDLTLAAAGLGGRASILAISLSIPQLASTKPCFISHVWKPMQVHLSKSSVVFELRLWPFLIPDLTTGLSMLLFRSSFRFYT
jgi:hypothetical protein